MAEIWKPIKDYEGLYEISNIGRVKSLPRNGTIKTEKILTPNMSGRYARIGLRDKIKIKYSVHRLVAEAFIPNPNNLPQDYLLLISQSLFHVPTENYYPLRL